MVCGAVRGGGGNGERGPGENLVGRKNLGSAVTGKYRLLFPQQCPAITGGAGPPHAGGVETEVALLGY